MIIFPQQDTKQIKQLNVSDVLGNMWSSFGLDLTSNIGRIRVSPRGMIVTDSTDDADLEVPVAFAMEQFNGGNDVKIWTIAGKMFYNTGDPSDAFIQDANAGSPAVGKGSDMELFNGALYVIGTAKVKKWDGTSWTEVGTNNGTVNTSCCIYDGRLYYSNNNSKISSIDLNDVLVNPTGTPNTNAYTLNLADFGAGGSSVNTITSIRASSNRIWIATIDRSSQNHSAGRNGKIFEWDGVKAQADKVYHLDSIGALALIIKGDIPYAIDANGRLLQYNGREFAEIARLPVDPNLYLRAPTNAITQKFIHPRGITIYNGRINIFINGELNTSARLLGESCPSGIWEYDENIGLYHKYTPSLWKYGTTATRTDYGQSRILDIGALFNAKTTSTSGNGSMLFGCEYFTTSSTTTNTEYGIFINDSDNTEQKSGYFVTTKIDSSNLKDMWQKVFAVFKKFRDNTDRICIKYRASEDTPTEFPLTWVTDTQFTTTANISAYGVGDEVEILQATGAGQMEHISSISFGGGTYTVNLNNAIIGATGTSRARLQHWKLAGEITTDTENYGEVPIGIPSPWIQLKVVMYFKGKDEMNYIKLINEKHE